MAAISVLVIDDERNLVRSISFSLTNEGMEVTGAYTGEEGLALAEQILPDVVLSDLGLPDMSGMTVLEKLHDRFSELPVIMISAHGDTRTAVQTVKQGALDYITKPFDVQELRLKNSGRQWTVLIVQFRQCSCNEGTHPGSRQQDGNGVGGGRTGATGILPGGAAVGGRLPLNIGRAEARADVDPERSRVPRAGRPTGSTEHFGRRPAALEGEVVDGKIVSGQAGVAVEQFEQDITACRSGKVDVLFKSMPLAILGQSAEIGLQLAVDI